MCVSVEDLESFGEENIYLSGGLQSMASEAECRYQDPQP